MRARALHPDVVVVTSALLHLNCVIVRGAGAAAEPTGPLNVIEATGAGAETFVIDSPVLPEELEMLPSLVGQANFPAPSGLLATHADWDHVLGPLAFPEAPLGLAETSARRLAAAPGAAQRELRSFDEELYLERERPLSLGAPQALPVPGHLEVGAKRLELHPTGGHTADGMAILIGWARVLVVGDYLSKIEIPMLGEGGDVGEYLSTLERLRPLVGAVDLIVPGHGPVLDPQDATRVLEEDVAYLRALAGQGAGAALPEGRRAAEMRAIHARNAERLASPPR